MHTAATAKKLIDDRGPRFAISGIIRPGEILVRYATTGEQAEQIADRLREEHHRQVRVHPPEGSVDLVVLGRELAAARELVRERTEILKAAVNRANEEGRAEAEIARQADVNRMTVRSWLGK